MNEQKVIKLLEDFQARLRGVYDADGKREMCKHVRSMLDSGHKISPEHRVWPRDKDDWQAVEYKFQIITLAYMKSNSLFYSYLMRLTMMLWLRDVDDKSIMETFEEVIDQVMVVTAFEITLRAHFDLTVPVRHGDADMHYLHVMNAVEVEIAKKHFDFSEQKLEKLVSEIYRSPNRSA